MGSQSVDSIFGDLPNYPGKRPPKNRAGTKKDVEADPFAFLRATYYTVRGEKKAFYTVGEVAKALGRRPGTIRMWEMRGIIPTPSFRTAPPEGEQIPGKSLKGRRLYSKQQVELLLHAVEQFDLDNPRSQDADWVGFKKYIQENWLSN
jgi:hypothetical protein